MQAECTQSKLALHERQQRHRAESPRLGQRAQVAVIRSGRNVAYDGNSVTAYQRR